METDGIFYTIHDWMLKKDIDLTETAILAIIHGFSMNGRCRYDGSRRFLASLVKCSVDKVDKSLKKLRDLGLIIKTEVFRDGVKFCEYVSAEGSRYGQGVAAGSGRGVADYGGGGSRSERHNNKEENINIKNNAATRTREVADAPQQPIKKFSYRDKLIAAGVTAENADRLLANRKANNLKNTEAAYNKLMGALEQVCNGRGVTYDEAVEYAGKKGWGFIDPSWNLEGLKARSNRTRTTQTIGDYLNKFAR
jgi:hypothetical protein